MSGPRRRSLRRRKGLSRRDFLKRAGAGAAVLGALPALTACGGSSPAGGSSGGADLRFEHGVASGDPLADRVILWTRVSGATAPTALDWVMATDPALQQVVRSGTVLASGSGDYTAKVDADGLLPGTTYYYRFNAGAARSPIGRTRTAPQGTLERLRVGVASCSSLAHGYFNAYRRLAERSDLDVILHLGDYIYEYGTGEYGSVRAYEPDHEILTKADYRQRYAQYRRDADLQELHRQFPVIAIWDDHETADNSWRDGANNHTEGVEGLWAQRKADAVAVYHEWLPIRTPDASNLERIYRSFRYGDLADFVMLDTRLIGRDLQASLVDAASINDADRSLLGAPQFAYLQAQLGSSGARWKFLGQQIMFGQLRIPSLPELSVLTGLPVEQLQALLEGLPVVSTGGLIINADQWDGYRAERARVFDLLETLNIDNAVVLTGDIHTSWAMDLSRDPAIPLVYNPLNGSGSLGVEFVCTSVTSPGLDQLNPLTPLLRLLNPHMKYVDLAQQGYMVLDITPERTQSEWWYVSTIAESGGTESLGTSWQVRAGARHLTAGEGATQPPASAPLPAP